MSSTKTTDSLFSAYKPEPIVEPTTTIVAPTTPKSTDPSLFEDTTAPIVNPSLYSDEGLGVNPPVTSDNYTDHMNSMAQANAQVDANGNPVYATYSYDPQSDTYTADYSAFGLTGDSATETFTSEQFLADNDRTFASMEGYEPVEDTQPPAEEDAFNIVNWYSDVLNAEDFEANLQIKKDYAFNNFDPNRGELAGTNFEGWARDQLIGLPFLELVREHSLAQSSPTATTFEVDYPYDYDGDNLYMKVPETGGNTDMYQGFSDEDREQYRDLQDRGYFLDISGGEAGVGEYTMMWFEDPPEESTWDTFLNNPITNIIAMGIPFGTAALTAIKAASGQTLHASDWASLVAGGLEASGIIKPPSVNAGGVEVSGTGLMGTTYEQTQAIISAAGAGDFSGVISTMVGGDLLGTLGFDEDTIQGWADASGLTSDAISQGLTGILSDVATGISLEEAVLNSGVQVLIEDFQNNGELSESLLNSIDGLSTMLEGWGDALDGSVLAPFLETVGNVADALPIEEMIEGFSGIAGTLTAAVADGLGAVTSGAMSLLGNFTDDQSGLTMEDLVVNIGNATGDTLETIMDAAGISFAEWLEASPQEQQQMYNQLSNFYSDITDLFDEEPDFTPPDVSTIPEDTTDDVEDTTDEFTDEYFENLYNTYGNALDTLTSETGVNIEDLISGAGTSLEELANATGVSIQELLGGAETSLSDLADATGQTIEELLDNAGTSLEELAAATGTSIDDLSFRSTS